VLVPMGPPDVDDIRRRVRDYGHVYLDLASLLTRPEYFETIISKVFDLNELMDYADLKNLFTQAKLTVPNIDAHSHFGFLSSSSRNVNILEAFHGLHEGRVLFGLDREYKKMQYINMTYRNLRQNQAYLDFPNYNAQIEAMREACYNSLKKYIELSQNPEMLQALIEKDEKGTKPKSLFLLLNHKNLNRSSIASYFSSKDYYAECVALVENRIKSLKLQESKIEKPKPEK